MAAGDQAGAVDVDVAELNCSARGYVDEETEVDRPAAVVAWTRRPSWLKTNWVSPLTWPSDEFSTALKRRPSSDGNGSPAAVIPRSVIGAPPGPAPVRRAGCSS